MRGRARPGETPGISSLEVVACRWTSPGAVRSRSSSPPRSSSPSSPSGAPPPSSCPTSGPSAFYAGGIAEQAVGKAAPWFILGVMLFSYAVRAIYIESSIMFVRGGVYRVVKEAMGGTLGKMSVSALLFDYVLTGPISATSAGQYIVGLLNDLAHRFGSSSSPPAQRNVGCPRGRRHHLLLVAEHAGPAGVEQRRAPHHADHDRDGGAPAGVGRRHAPHARRPAAAAADARAHPLLAGCARLAARDRLAGVHRHRHPRRPRPLVPGHERLGVAGAGVPRDRAPEAGQPAAGRARHLRLQRGLHRLGELPRGGAHPRRHAREVLRQPDLRPRDAPGWARCRCGCSSRASSWWSAS